MGKFVTVQIDTTSFAQIKQREYGVGGVAGPDDGSQAVNDLKLWTGNNVAGVEDYYGDSELAFAITKFFSQLNARKCWGVVEGAAEEEIDDEIPRFTDGSLAIKVKIADWIEVDDFLQVSNVPLVAWDDPAHDTVYCSGTPLIFTTDYTVAIATGKISLTAAGIAACVLLADGDGYVYFTVDYTIAGLASALKKLRNPGKSLPTLLWLTSSGEYTETRTDDELKTLMNHCILTSPSGRYRTAIVALESGIPAAWKTTALALGHYRVMMVAHQSEVDVAACLAGTRASYVPWESMCNKPVIGLEQEPGVWEDQEVDAFELRNVNVLFHEFFAEPETKIVLSESMTMDTTGELGFSDLIDTLDDLSFLLQAGLSKSSISGHIRMNLQGMQLLHGEMRALLLPRTYNFGRGLGEIGDNIVIVNPFYEYLLVPLARRSTDEQILIDNMRAIRILQNVRLGVEYENAFHYLDLKIKV